ncbi:Zeaxanthin epoxidase [Actinidia chinensis var. chinensis]|uniref:Zeaxanthin epoxidase n=1 Tax=Actinidia chinensis var. chinensis TaxID=1590841 RepID=A0A2R6QTY1_ACTCC|nr:Zeaxanthin epoxidase [Actinidia chinensis var. chinensis]
MEISSQSLSFAKLSKPQSCSTATLSPLFFHSKSVPNHSVSFLGLRILPIKLQCVGIKSRQNRNFLGAIHASEAESTATDDAERWLLQPVGDGDSRHIGFKVSMPGAFEIASSVVTVGRLPEKADMVIPVATVSGVHARIQKNNGSLLVTDLDSTNGTFIDEKRLRPGVAATISTGSCITFGDTHLAMFRVSKLKNVEVSGKSEESEAKAETEKSSETSEITS